MHDEWRGSKPPRETWSSMSHSSEVGCSEGRITKQRVLKDLHTLLRPSL